MLYIRSSSGTSGTGGITPGLPSGWQADDIFVYAVESNAADAVAIPAGFTEFSWSPIIGTATRLTGFWRRAVGGDTAPTLADPGDHIVARVIAIAGATTAGDPFTVASETEAAGSNAVSFPAVTPGIGAGWLGIVGYGRDSTTTPLPTFNGEGLDDLTEDSTAQASTSGGGGGVNFVFGIADTAGALTPTGSLSNTEERIVVAMVVTPAVDNNDYVYNEQFLTVAIDHYDDVLVNAIEFIAVADQMALNVITNNMQMITVVVPPDEPEVSGRRRNFMNFCP